MKSIGLASSSSGSSEVTVKVGLYESHAMTSSTAREVLLVALVEEERLDTGEIQNANGSGHARHKGYAPLLENSRWAIARSLMTKASILFLNAWVDRE
jgi:hypothetical protein